MLPDSRRAVLAARLRRGRVEDTDASAKRISRRPPDLVNPPASYGQEQLWFIDSFAPGQATYHIPCLIRLRGRLDARALRRALEGLVDRHEALRTRLVTDPAGQLVQVIDPPAPVPLDVVDLSDLDPAAKDAQVRQFIRAASLCPFSLAQGPLLRTSLVRLGRAEHVLVAVIHHAVFDGWSAGVLRRELAAFYQAEVAGEPAGLAELPVQFADYAVWERDRLRGGELDALERYWRDVMDGFELVHFPTDHPRPVIEGFDGGTASRLTDRKLLTALRELSRAERSTMFATVLAALVALLYRYTGQADLVVGTLSANRGKAALTPLIGFLVNTLPIRVDSSGDPPFTELLRRVREVTVAAFAHQDLPFGKLVETLGVQRDPGRSPVFQIAMAYAEHDTASVVAEGVEFAPSDLPPGVDAAKFDLTIRAEARRDGLWLECSYKTALFEAATAQRLLGHLETLLRGVAADPSAPVSRLPMLSNAELRAELTEWNDTAATVPVRCIHHGFQDQAAATPGAIAATCDGQHLTYAELNARANQIARQLRSAGVGPEVLVGVCMPASLRRLAGLLAIMKAGGGYVPVDPSVPPERLAFLMRDTGMKVILTDDPAIAAAVLAPMALSLDACWDQVGQLDDTNLDDATGTGPDPTGVTPANVAWVLYTSGSTGQPKGVVIEHRNAANFLHGRIKAWNIGQSSTVLQFANYTWDVSTRDMFMSLLGGATLVLAPAETLHSPQRLTALIRESKVTFAALPPAVLSLLNSAEFPDLQVLVAGGEELPGDLARHWARPGLRLINGYGPTEATVMSVHAEIGPDTPLPPPIGLPPWPNCQAYVLDQNLNPVPVGVTGELHIGGASITRGYLNRPALTAQLFIADPFTPGQRLYKTGDLARRRPDGYIVYAGRIDNQVKIRGLRIELGEVAAALASHPHVAQAVATVITDQAGQRQLTGYVRSHSATPAALTDLRDHLARILPAYMIPAHLITVPDFPLNASGKIDHTQLPPPQAPTDTASEDPATPTEIMLAGLYATLLGASRAGATDNFFDLGGNSLAAMRLVDMIHRETGVDLGVTAVFLRPTLRELAARIDAAAGDGETPGTRSLAELSIGAGDIPLHVIHPVGGTVSAYTDLARELAGRFKVYGLQAPALSGEGTLASSLPDLVADYTQRIRAACPDGPYQLAGWSMGGVVAFEIAQRLEQDGAQVALLILLDAPYRLPAEHPASAGHLAGRFVADAAGSLGWHTATAPDPATATADEQLGWLAAQLGGEPGDGSVRTQLRQRMEVFGAHHQMLAGYHPAGPAVRAPTLIVSADRSPNAPFRDDWPGMLASPASTLGVDSDHYGFLRPPLVADVAAAILKWQAAVA